MNSCQLINPVAANTDEFVQSLNLVQSLNFMPMLSGSQHN
ncbi:MAG: hypothetical protein RLZZ516_227 [Cyanobacteriota bacterium]|jgi:hypothetical protein